MKRPALVRALAEPVRASCELATSVTLLPFLRMLPDGDGHPVLVLPGFMASDGSTRPLRRLLRTLGYEAAGWGLGRNVGPTERVVNEMPALIDRTAQRTGQAVSLVGWSLGGIYARHLAAGTPRLIRSVVTLGSPVRSDARRSTNASPLFEALRAIHVPGHPLLDDGVPLAVPVTAVHTRSDGIVPWRTCLVQDAPTAENLRVRGSHVGLGFNPAAFYIIADRLAQPEGTWSGFTAPRPYQRIITAVPGPTPTAGASPS
ncbi:MAG: alpha/beta hydrolase [Acidimicrobiia bacterium]|nr:alpha/beta hydrolase [Acidimicrobiia bacterium]